MHKIFFFYYVEPSLATDMFVTDYLVRMGRLRAKNSAPISWSDFKDSESAAYAVIIASKTAAVANPDEKSNM